jgi:RHS repeat-associated protein
VFVATYTYNALDQRIGFKDSSTQTWTVYDGPTADAEPYADFDGSGTLTERYLHGPGVVNGAVVDELLARTSSGGTTAWYLTDKLDSVDNIVSSSGTALDTIVYDSFGNITTESNASNGDRFKFAGMEYDSTTGQYYDHARAYDQSLGRFTSVDPMGFRAGDVDLYGYVDNSPWRATDPSGLWQVPMPNPVMFNPRFWQNQMTYYEDLMRIESIDYERLMKARSNLAQTEQGIMDIVMEQTKIEFDLQMQQHQRLTKQFIVKFELTMEAVKKLYAAVTAKYQSKAEQINRLRELAVQIQISEAKIAYYKQMANEAANNKRQAQNLMGPPQTGKQ